MSMTAYAKGFSAEELRLFLAFWPRIPAEADGAQKMLVEDEDIILGDDAELLAWCYLYELPIKQHLSRALTGIMQEFSSILPDEQVLSWLKQIADAPNQLSELPSIFEKIGRHFDKVESPSKEELERLRCNLASVYGLGMSMYNTMRCVLFHGCFLNELIERVCSGDDKALFDAIRIDPTVIGCLSVSSRISKAALLQDNRFFTKLKAAINGKLAKREQANFQKMRLVFEILHEAGATDLNDEQLHQLFVDELSLYSSNAKGGGNAKALRKFANTYMKKNSTT